MGERSRQKCVFGLRLSAYYDAKLIKIHLTSKSSSTEMIVESMEYTEDWIMTGENNDIQPWFQTK